MLREFLSNWSPTVETTPGLRQSGAMPYSVVEGRVVFLLITSRRTGRWIFPKGDIEPDMTPWDSAAQEALEEAGIEGEVETTVIGTYGGTLNDKLDTPVDVDIYPLRVTVQHQDWLERKQRHRHWAGCEEAARLLEDERKAAIVMALEHRLTGVTQA